MFFKKKEEPSKNYRKTGLETNNSNYGWYVCAHCGRKIRKDDVDVDHIMPKSKGGSNDPRNLQILCRSCNRSKQDDTSRTKQDLKMRKVTYGQNQRAPYFKEKTKNEMREIRENLSKASNRDILEMLNDPKFAPIEKVIRNEAKKRGLL